ncbi:MAG: amino acid permease [Candidatus Marinimicrobia bacterium]|nr:amino acid permease [Candidatus Neomarinimicrobiota bacterium]
MQETLSEYKKDLGLKESVAIVISRIIGSGIFRTPAPIMALVGCTSLFGLVWVIGGIITIFGAVIYAELSAMLPKSGGPYVFLKEAYGPYIAFIRGWAMFFVSETASIVAVALVFTEYLNAIWELTAGTPFNLPITFAISLFTIWTLTGINMFGVSMSGKVQVFFSMVKVGALGAIIGTTLTSFSTGNIQNFVNPLWPESFGWETILAVGAALRYSFFAFSGWEGATYMAEEVKNPQKTLPLSLFLGIGGVMLLYIGTNLGYLFQLDVQAITENKWVATAAMKVVLGATGGILISVAVAINAFGNISTQILCKSRTWHAMARDGLFFDKFKELHPVFKTPNNALIGQGIWATVLLIFSVAATYLQSGSSGSNAYEVMIDFFSATSTIFNLLTFYAIYILRKKWPNKERPYKALLYPWSMIVVLILYSAFLIITFITAFIPSMIGLALTASGTIYYFKKIK